MIQVQAMPGELAAGHARRYGLLNRVHPGQLLDAVRGEVSRGQQADNSKTVLEMLAEMSNMSTERYAGAHSMLPVLRVAQREGDLRPHGCKAARVLLRQFGMSSPKSEGYICADCVQDDQRRFGFSWFKREHHLFGVDWCIHHESLLLRVLDPDPLSALPHSWLGAGLIEPAREHVGPLNGAGEFLQKLAAISVAILARRRPISTTAIHAKIRARLGELGLSRTRYGRKPPLSWYLKQVAPTDWLQWHLPDIRDAGAYCRLDMLDGFMTMLAPAAGHAYLVAMACLFDSVEDVLECITDLARPNVVHEFQPKPAARSDVDAYSLQ